jgi:hypothetical protein
MDVDTLDKVNNLEGSWSDETIPDMWTVDHIALRLVGAFQILDRCPKVRGPRAPGSTWPQTTKHDWLDTEMAPRERALECKMRPSATELSHMETAMEWLRLLRQTDSGMALVTGLWAYNAARGRSIKELCQTKSWALHTFYRKRSKALIYIVGKLNALGTPVF